MPHAHASTARIEELDPLTQMRLLRGRQCRLAQYSYLLDPAFARRHGFSVMCGLSRPIRFRDGSAHEASGC